MHEIPQPSIYRVLTVLRLSAHMARDGGIFTGSTSRLQVRRKFLADLSLNSWPLRQRVRDLKQLLMRVPPLTAEQQTQEERPAKYSRTEVDPISMSAAEQPRVLPPEPAPGATEAIHVPEAVTAAETTVGFPTARKRSVNPAVRAARQRIKQRARRRALGPYAGGATRARSIQRRKKK